MEIPDTPSQVLNAPSHVTNTPSQCKRHQVHQPKQQVRLISIYAVLSRCNLCCKFTRKIYRPKNAVAYKKWQISGMVSCEVNMQFQFWVPLEMAYIWPHGVIPPLHILWKFLPKNLVKSLSQFNTSKYFQINPDKNPRKRKLGIYFSVTQYKPSKVKENSKKYVL